MHSSFVLQWCLSGMKWLVGVGTALLALVNAWMPQHAAVPEKLEPAVRASLDLTPCHLEDLAEEVLCGVHEVYEDRDAASGRRIPVHIAVLPPLRRAAAACGSSTYRAPTPSLPLTGLAWHARSAKSSSLNRPTFQNS